jgi:hypothetical protein
MRIASLRIATNEGAYSRSFQITAFLPESNNFPLLTQERYFTNSSFIPLNFTRVAIDNITDSLRINIRNVGFQPHHGYTYSVNIQPLHVFTVAEWQEWLRINHPPPSRSQAAPAQQTPQQAQAQPASLPGQTAQDQAAPQVSTARQTQEQLEASANSKIWENYVSASRRRAVSPFIFFTFAEELDFWEYIWLSAFGRVFGTLQATNWGISWEALNINYSVMPFVSLGVGLGGGVSFAEEGRQEWNWIGAKAYAGFTVPLYANKNDFGIRLFGDALFEIGYSDWGSLLFANAELGFALNPGFEAGLLIGDYVWPDSFEISYGITWYANNRYKHSLGLSLRYVPMKFYY